MREHDLAKFKGLSQADLTQFVSGRLMGQQVPPIIYSDLFGGGGGQDPEYPDEAITRVILSGDSNLRQRTLGILSIQYHSIWEEVFSQTENIILEDATQKRLGALTTILDLTSPVEFADMERKTFERTVDVYKSNKTLLTETLIYNAARALISQDDPDNPESLRLWKKAFDAEVAEAYAINAFIGSSMPKEVVEEEFKTLFKRELNRDRSKADISILTFRFAQKFGASSTRSLFNDVIDIDTLTEEEKLKAREEFIEWEIFYTEHGSNMA